MAPLDPKSIPKKTLEKVLRECHLSALISSDKGRTFFESYLINKLPEFNKYWTFYNSVNEITWNSENQEQLLVCIKECFEKHIAIGADSQDRVDACLGENRIVVKKLSKAISEKDIENLCTTFKDLQKSAFQHLNKEVFGGLVEVLNSEYSSRKSRCDLL